MNPVSSSGPAKLAPALPSAGASFAGPEEDTGFIRSPLGCAGAPRRSIERDSPYGRSISIGRNVVQRISIA